MKNSSGMKGMDGRGSRVEPRHANAQTTRIIGSAASCMNIRSSPKGLRSASATRRYAKIASLLLVCAAAIFMVSSMAVLPVGKAIAEGPSAPGIEAPPVPPYYAAGYTYDAFGVILPDCVVNITNMRTGAYNLTTSDGAGFYIFDIANQLPEPGGFLVGDLINVTATKDMAIGWNESVTLPMGFVAIDVTLNGVIPEFPMMVLPVVGLLAMFIVVSIRRRGKQ